MSAADQLTWLATPLSNGKSAGQLVVHGIQGEHTLCGLSSARHKWFSVDNVDDPAWCEICDPEAAAIPKSGNTPKRRFRRSTREGRLASVPSEAILATDLCKTMKVTYRQLDYWFRRGWLQNINPGRGSGSSRYVTSAEAEVVAMMGRLVEAGIEPESAARAARNGGQLAPGVRVVLDEAD